MGKVSVIIFYAGGLELKLSEKTFSEAMELVWRGPAFEKHEPLKLMFESTKKMLFMDRQLFNSFLDGNIDLKELIERTECDDVYRNISEIFIAEAKTTIENGNLWKLKNREFLLIDDDQFLKFKFLPEKFEIAK